MKPTMRDNRAAIILSIAALFVVAAVPALPVAPIHLWSHHYGSAVSDDGLAVAVDASGNVLITGVFFLTANFGGGNLVSAGGADIFVAKYNASGAHQWSRRFGGTGNDVGNSIAVDGAGNVLVAGDFSGTADFGGGNVVSAGDLDIFVAKYDANGVYQWSHGFGSTLMDEGHSVAADGSGNAIVTGYFQETVDFGGGGLVSTGHYDVFVAKYGANGVHQWSRLGGSAGTDRGRSAAVDGSDNVIVTGSFSTPWANFGGANLYPVGSSDIFVAKYNANGVHQWSQGFGSTGGDVGLSVAADEAANVIIAGQCLGTVDFGGGNRAGLGGLDIFLAKYDANGAHLWSHVLGGTASEEGNSVAVDGSGNVDLTGYFYGTVDLGGNDLVSAGTNDIFVATYNASGVHQWSQRFGSTGIDEGRSIAADDGGNLIATGGYQGTVNFGGGNLTSVGWGDVFVLKYGPDPACPLITSIADIGNDQGRKVKIRFNASALDSVSSPTPILRYVSFRRDDPAPPAAPYSRSRGGLSDREALDVGWTEVGSVGAFTKDSYGIDVPTLGDSTNAHGQYHSVFFVRAASAVPGVFFDSPPDSGYSLDNLAPGVPTNLVYSAGVLDWNKSTAEDFDYFSVYGANTSSFAAATLVDYCVDPTMDVTASPHVFYFVTATDFSGNEGAAAMVNTLSGAGGTPRNYVLSISAYPNPFNPSTTIRYTLPSHGRVTVAIYDARGALVATLVDGAREAGAYTERWDGRDNTGRVASSGVYFARVGHPSGTRAYKMMLLK